VSGPARRPGAEEVANRALVLYAVVRRGAIELVVNETGGDPTRITQAERARVETDTWLERESLAGALTEQERRSLAAVSGSWPREAINDALWRKEAFGTLLWALEHVEAMPGPGTEFVQEDLDRAVTRYGSVAAFRANGRLRPPGQLEDAWLEADAWFGAMEGREGGDATLASIAAERFRALSWLRDAAAEPA
jgi:Domain of unknown function (DUF4272)